MICCQYSNYWKQKILRQGQIFAQNPYNLEFEFHRASPVPTCHSSAQLSSFCSHPEKHSRKHMGTSDRNKFVDYIKYDDKCHLQCLHHWPKMVNSGIKSVKCMPKRNVCRQVEKEFRLSTNLTNLIHIRHRVILSFKLGRVQVFVFIKKTKLKRTKHAYKCHDIIIILITIVILLLINYFINPTKTFPH